jgi:hypothetical protein
MIGHYYGPKAYPKLSGMYIFLTSGFASPAGFVGGKIFDIYGSYTKSFELDAALATVAILAVIFAAMPKPRGEMHVVAVQQELA